MSVESPRRLSVAARRILSEARDGCRRRSVDFQFDPAKGSGILRQPWSTLRLTSRRRGGKCPLKACFPSRQPQPSLRRGLALHAATFLAKS